MYTPNLATTFKAMLGKKRLRNSGFFCATSIQVLTKKMRDYGVSVFSKRVSTFFEQVVKKCVKHD